MLYVMQAIYVFPVELTMQLPKAPHVASHGSPQEASRELPKELPKAASQGGFPVKPPKEASQ